MGQVAEAGQVMVRASRCSSACSQGATCHMPPQLARRCVATSAHPSRLHTCRNFAGILIIWDRAFGTFEAEQSSRPCVYGLNASVSVAGRFVAAAAASCAAGLMVGHCTAQHVQPTICVLPPTPAMQPIVQGTYNPLWHQAHHLAATLRLAGKVRLSSAC